MRYSRAGVTRVRELPLFPLGTVVFPGGRLMLKVFEQRYLRLVKTLLAEGGSFVIAGIREGREVGQAAQTHAVGTEVSIGQWDMPQTGIFEIEVHAHERVALHATRVEPDGLMHARVEDLRSEPACELPDDCMLCAEVLRQLVQQFGAERFGPALDFENATWVGHRLAEVLPFPLSVKQHLLELDDGLARLRLLDDYLRKLD
jgi:Lon protease-like protein